MKRIVTVLLIILFSLAVGSCGDASVKKPAKTDGDIVSSKYLIDSFTRDNTAGDEKQVNITSVSIDGYSRRCLFEHPVGLPGKDQEVIFTGIPLVDGETLEFGIGIREAAYTAVVDGKHLGGIIFGVLIDDGKKREPVFERTLRPFEIKEDRGWHDCSVDLSPYAGKTVNIIFTTRFAEGSWVWGHALWSEPVLLSPLLKEARKGYDTSISDVLSHENVCLLDSLKKGNNKGGEKAVCVVDETMRGDLRRCLFERPAGVSGKDQEVVFKDLLVNDGARLEFGIGVREATYVAVVDGRHLGGIIFRIFVADGENRDLVFEHTLRPFENEQDRGWHDFSLDLSKYAGKNVDIIFATRFAQGDPVLGQALWSRPVLINAPPLADAPNIILISIDTLRADHLGCYGYDRDTSPNIDAFARDAVLYKYSFSHAPHTLESHASIMTSLNPARHTAASGKLDDNFITMAELLSHLGYHTVSYNGGLLVSKEYGLGQGFDEYYSFRNPCYEDDVWWEVNGAIDFIKKSRCDRPADEKFFLFLHTYEVHAFYDPPDAYKREFISESDLNSPELPDLVKTGAIPKYVAEYGTTHKDYNFPANEKEYFFNLYDAGIKYTDEWIGKFFDFLKKEDLYDNSLIIIVADHGEQFYEHEGWSHRTVYGHDLYVPLIIKYPQNREKGIEKERIARSIDVLPTILHDFLDVNITDADFDGIPLSEPLKDAVTVGSVAELRTKHGAKKDLMELSALNDTYKLVYETRTNKYEVYEYKKDMLDMKKVTVDKSVIDELLTVVSGEYSTFQKNMKKREGVGETEDRNDEEATKKLKDLGYIQ